jgi:hypothetical protein
MKKSNNKSGNDEKLIEFYDEVFLEYIQKYEELEFLKEVENAFLHPSFREKKGRGKNKAKQTQCFVEDKEYSSELKEYKKISLKGTSKLFITLFYKEYIKIKKKPLSDIFSVSFDKFCEENSDTLKKLRFYDTEIDLLKKAFTNYDKLWEARGARYIDKTKLILDEHKLDDLMRIAMNFKIYLKGPSKIIYPKDCSSYLSKFAREHFTSVFSRNQGYPSTPNSHDDIKYFRKLLLSRPAEITKAKGRKRRYLEISSKLQLNEILDEIDEKKKILNDLLSPYFASEFVSYKLYKSYFDKNCKLVLSTEI